MLLDRQSNCDLLQGSIHTQTGQETVRGGARMVLGRKTWYMQKTRLVFAPLNMNPDYRHRPRCECHNFNLPLSVSCHFSSNSCILLVVFLHFPPHFAYSCQGHASDNLTPPKGNIDQLDPRRFVWRLSSPQ